MNRKYNVGLGTASILETELYGILSKIFEHNNRGLIIDTAMAYKSEKIIGDFITHHPISRNNLFIIDKINYPNQIIGVRKSLENSLKKLNTDYLDLLCIHSPRYSNYIKTWKEMEKMKDEGLVNHIGLSNFYYIELQQIISISNCNIYSNQIPLRINDLSTTNLIELCKANDISIQICMAFRSALSNERLVGLLKSIAKNCDASWYQVMVTWLVKNKLVPIIGTKSYEHFIENDNLITINDNEMHILNSEVGLYCNC